MDRPRRTLSDQVAETLERRVLAGTYPAGTKLPPETLLATELGVNRFTVRAAMNRLEQLRLIQRRPGAGGTLVLDYLDHASIDVLEYLVLGQDGTVNVEVLANALEMAALLSAEVAALAARRRTEADLAELRVVVAQMAGETSLSQLFWLDFAFNWRVARASGNVMPRLLLNSVRGLLEKHTHLLETLWVTPGSIGPGYEHVVTALQAGDAARARELVLWVWTSRHHRFVEAASRLPGPLRTRPSGDAATGRPPTEPFPLDRAGRPRRAKGGTGSRGREAPDARR